MVGRRAVRICLLLASLWGLHSGCSKPAKPVPPAAVESPRTVEEKPDLAAPAKAAEPPKPAAVTDSQPDAGAVGPDGGSTAAAEGEGDAAGEDAADSSAHGDILALDSSGKLIVIKDADIELRCPTKKKDDVTCSVFLQALIKRKDQEVKLCSESDALAGIDIDKLKFESSKAEGSATLTLIDIPKRGGSLVSVETKISGGEGTKQSVTDVTWYILELSDKEGSATWTRVLGYEANNSLDHEGEEDGALSIESDVILEQQSRSCLGFPDIVLRTTQTETPHNRRAREKKSKVQYRWDGTTYVEAAGKPGPECKKSDTACKKQEIFCNHRCIPKDTPEFCGDCTHRCPGIGQSGATISCKDPATHTCDMDCSGENYDLDGRLENGCEARPNGRLFHARESPLDLGAKNCKDLESKMKFEGELLSDLRVHRDPPIPRIDESGMAPFFARVVAMGGLLCRADLEVRVKSFAKLATGPCYELAITGGITPQSLRFSGKDDQVLKVPAPAYREGDKLLFEVRSRCPRSASRMSFDVELHL